MPPVIVEAPKRDGIRARINASSGKPPRLFGRGLSRMACFLTMKSAARRSMPRRGAADYHRRQMSRECVPRY